MIEHIDKQLAECIWTMQDHAPYTSTYKVAQQQHADLLVIKEAYAALCATLELLMICGSEGIKVARSLVGPVLAKIDAMATEEKEGSEHIEMQLATLNVSAWLPDNSPLTCTAVDGALLISVGKSVLQFAAEQHPDFWDGESGPDTPNIKITDIETFAKEVALAINNEAEDGSTLLNRRLDDAIRQAVESGCEGVDHG